MSFLKVNQLRLKLGEHQVLNGISFELAVGEFIIILGSNGSGKSSLLKTIYREYNITAGDITLMGKHLAKYPYKPFYNKVALLNQNYNQALFNDLTISENFKLFSHNHDLKSEQEFIQDLKRYNDKFRSIDKLEQTKVAKLSGGQKQTLALLLLILRKPKLILLDEHTSALDKNAEESLMKLTYQIIKEHNISCMMVTHNLDTATLYGDRIMIIKDGVISVILEKKDTVMHKQLFLEYF
ncbi:MAG: ATP-binding cassette domain-containing protein [Burkholderiales bacterium]|nr:ATP-binding cassette domain-containing protein [Burkholderiales bacterium]